jgi:hypothetical protein
MQSWSTPLKRSFIIGKDRQRSVHDMTLDSFDHNGFDKKTFLQENLDLFGNAFTGWTGKVIQDYREVQRGCKANIYTSVKDPAEDPT